MVASSWLHWVKFGLLWLLVVGCWSVVCFCWLVVFFSLVGWVGGRAWRAGGRVVRLIVRSLSGWLVGMFVCVFWLVIFSSVMAFHVMSCDAVTFVNICLGFCQVYVSQQSMQNVIYIHTCTYDVCIDTEAFVSHACVV